MPIQTSDARTSASSTVRTCRVEVASQRQVRLWSDLKEVCNLLHITVTASVYNEELLFERVPFRTGQRIHRIGQAFDTLHIVRSGFLKTVLIDEFGNEQVLGFPMKGEMMGVDGIHASHYASESVALSDCELILMPFKNLTALGRKHLELESGICGVMSRALQRDQAMIGILGALSAEARVARFLVSLANRFAALGYSSRLFNLRMTRRDIGNYLGVTEETVSRALSAFKKDGLITVDHRAIGIRDVKALATLRRLPPSRLRANRNSIPKQKNALEPRDDDQILLTTI